jgi:hypothetical protein
MIDPITATLLRSPTPTLILRASDPVIAVVRQTLEPNLMIDLRDAEATSDASKQDIDTAFGRGWALLLVCNEQLTSPAHALLSELIRGFLHLPDAPRRLPKTRVMVVACTGASPHEAWAHWVPFRMDGRDLIDPPGR